MQILLIAGVIGAVLLIGAVIYNRWRQSHGTCVSCGSKSQFGYSKEAESELADISKLCFKCLATNLTSDYEQYRGKALVIEPAAGLPCYVFQPNSRWAAMTQGVVAVAKYVGQHGG